WTQVVSNARLCKALLDRITDRAHIIGTGSDSYRFRRTLELRGRHPRTTSQWVIHVIHSVHREKGPFNGVGTAITGRPPPRIMASGTALLVSEKWATSYGSAGMRPSPRLAAAAAAGGAGWRRHCGRAWRQSRSGQRLACGLADVLEIRCQGCSVASGQV